MPSWTPGWDAVPPPLLDFWAERHLALLTTLRPDGTPHVVPVGVAVDLEQRCAWVITDGASAKARHLPVDDATQAGAPVAVGQVDGARWATLEGLAVVRRDPTSVARAVERYAARYRTPRPNPTRVALRIEVTRVLASRGLLETDPTDPPA